MSEIKNALAERVLTAELHQHLKVEGATQAAGEAPKSGIHRTSYSTKTVLNDTVKVEFGIPRDLIGTARSTRSRSRDHQYRFVHRPPQHQGIHGPLLVKLWPDD